MCARRYGRHQDHVACENVKQRQRTHDVVIFRIQQRVTQPSVIGHAGILVLCNLWHTGRTAGMEVKRYPILLRIIKGQVSRLFRDLGVKILVGCLICHAQLWPDQGHDP